MIVSGVMSASTRLGSWSDLTTSYGVLVLVKVAAFVALGVAGWWHRRITIDAISRTEKRVSCWMAAARERPSRNSITRNAGPMS